MGLFIDTLSRNLHNLLVFFDPETSGPTNCRDQIGAAREPHPPDDDDDDLREFNKYAKK
jgi:hypothetical protein